MKRTPGCIDQLANGRWRLRMTIAGKQETVGFYDTEGEAETARAATIDVVADSAIDYEGLTLGELGKKVLTRREVTKKVRDPDADWSRWNQHVKGDLIERIAVKRMRTEHLHRWMGRLEDKRLAPQSRRNCLNLVRVVLREAVLDGVIRDNPAKELRISGKSEAWTYLAPEEQTALLSASASVDRHLIAWALGTGMRAGELVTMRLADVLLGDNPVAIVRYGKAPSKPTKTGRARRVPLFGVALAAIESWLPTLKLYAPHNPHGLLFPRERGGFRSEEHIIPWESWKRTLRDAGIARRFRWHDLRHSCASSLVSGWWGRRWSLEEVKDMLGHTSILITQRYAHLAESALEAAGAATPGVVTSSQLSDGSGAPGVTRTPGQLLRKQLLYPSELRAQGKDLGKPCLSQNPAEIASGDLGLTRSKRLPPDVALGARFLEGIARAKGAS